jgi:hypothetical protein
VPLCVVRVQRTITYPAAAGVCLACFAGALTLVAAGAARSQASLTSPAGPSARLAPRTRTSHCARGVLPDRRCSPGAISRGLSRAVLCSPGFHTSSVRNVPESEKHLVEIEYGLAPKGYGRTREIDHIVPLELGGANDIANLYPEPGSGPANYRFKDRLENRLHGLVCSGAMRLGVAQRTIARNWRVLYLRVFGVAAI